MNKVELVAELNGRLSKSSLNLPDFRMTVTKSGKNIG